MNTNNDLKITMPWQPEPPLKWMDNAACANTNINWENLGEHHQQTLCTKCAVINECRTWNDQMEGDAKYLHDVYGAETPHQRRQRREENQSAEELEAILTFLTRPKRRATDIRLGDMCRNKKHLLATINDFRVHTQSGHYSARCKRCATERNAA